MATFPSPVEAAALRVWHLLPRFLRAPLVPLAGLFGPHTATAPVSPGAEDDVQLDGRLWLVRSPWPTLTLHEVFGLLWRWVERDQELDNDVWRERVSEVLAWTQPQALAWQRKSRL